MLRHLFKLILLALILFELFCTGDVRAQTKAPSEALVDFFLTQNINRRLSVRVVKELPLSGYDKHVWCYDQTPGFVAFDLHSLVKRSLDGAVIKLADVDKVVNSRSFACLRNGKTILLFSEQYDFLYLYENGQLATYALDSVPNIFSVRFGSLLSPDGSIVAVPGNFSHISGPDHLKSKRILRVDSGDVFWTEKYIFHRNLKGGYTVTARSDLKPAREISFKTADLIDGIYECGRGVYIFLYTDDAELRYVETFNPDNSLSNKNKPLFTNVGVVEPHPSGCVISIIKPDRSKIDHAKQLIALSGEKSQVIDVSALNLQTEDFSWSEDVHYFFMSKNNEQLLILGIAEESKK